MLWPRLVVLALLADTASREQSRKLQEALDWMGARGGCAVAMPLFQAAAAGPDRNISARALLFIGKCEEALGRKSAAAAVYTRITREGSAERTVVSEARRRLGALLQPPTLATRLKRHDVTIRVARRIRTPAPVLSAVLARRDSELYMTGPDSVSILDTASGIVVATIPLGATPAVLTPLPRTDGVLAGLPPARLAVIHTQDRSVTFWDTVGGPVLDIAVSRSEEKAWLAMDTHGVREFDLRTGRGTPLAAPPGAKCVALSPDERTLYAGLLHTAYGSPPGHDALVWLDTRSRNLLHRITDLPYITDSLTVTPDGEQLWANAGDACNGPAYDHRGCPRGVTFLTHVLDTRTRRLLAEIPVEGRAVPFPDGSGVAILGRAEMLFIDRSRFTAIETVPVPGATSLAFSADGRTAYATAPDGITVLEIR